MLDAKSLLDTILGGEAAQRATAAAQSAGSALAGIAARSEERLKGTAVGEAVTEAKKSPSRTPRPQWPQQEVSPHCFWERPRAGALPREQSSSAGSRRSAE